MLLTTELRIRYSQDYHLAEIRSQYQAELNRTVDQIQMYRGRYDDVSEDTKVPWYFIAIIHHMESDGNFHTHLHNGDSLSSRTHNDPTGRPPPPAVPPFTWSQSACDAILYEYAQVRPDTWTVSDILWALEKYNGWGYRNLTKYNCPNILTPYLWSFTTLYKSGKFVSDHHYSPYVVSDQAGAVAILKTLEARNLVTL